jgi:hypothetical protein
MVFAASDVSTQNFSGALSQISGLTSFVTIYACQYDPALMFSQWANDEARLGLGGFGNRVFRSGLYTVEVSAATHNYIFADDRVIVDFDLLIAGAHDPSSPERGLKVHGGQSGDYYTIDLF